MDEPRVSIIVAVKDSQDTIKKCVDSLLALDFHSKEVIVVDDGSRESTGEILAGYAGQIIKVITNEYTIGPSESRNKGVGAARGEFVAFTDGDCIVDKGWLNELLAGFSQYRQAAACGGAQGIPGDASDFEKSVFLFMSKTGLLCDYTRKFVTGVIRAVNHNPSCNVMYKRDVFINSGGFLKGLWPGEDVELDYRLKKKGFLLVSNPKAVVLHYRPRNLSSFLRMMARYGMAQGQLVKKYGLFRKIHFFPIISFTLGLIFILFMLLKPFAAAILLLAFILTPILLFGAKLEMFIISFSTVFCWNFGFLKGYAEQEN